MQRQQSSSPASIFCVAAPHDAALLAEWEEHLLPLQQAGHITVWSERHIQLGAVPRMQQIHDHLDQSDLMVLLVSAAFFANDECIALMERAIERAENGEACLIPLLLRPVAWRESSLAPFPYIPSNNRPVTEWSNRDAAFDECVRDIRRLLGRPITAPLPRHYTHAEALQNQNRMRMLRRVRAIWIDGLLTPSLHHATKIELGLQDRPDVLENPLRLQVQETNQPPKALPDGTTIVQVYDRADGELLILGEPGAGKTTLLLELTRILLERAEKDERLPMPIVFHLSSWAEKRHPLRTWLVEELRTKYQVPYKIGENWIDDDYVLPLLDGLDEVAKDARSTCVKHINDYCQLRLTGGGSSIVVCCRSEEYAALSIRLMLQHAVSIQPLTNKQIFTYLEQAGKQVEMLRQVLKKDVELRKLARQPLILNVFTLAYQGATLSKMPIGKTREEMLHTIFAQYVGRMLNRREQSKHWEPEQMVHWLTFLAKQMQQHDPTVFSVENLQPTWLSEKRQLRYQQRVKLLWEPLGGLVVGLVSGLISGQFAGLVFGLFNGVSFGSLCWLIFSIFGKLPRGRDTRISPVEALTWSWKKAGGWFAFGLVSGLIGNLFLRLSSKQLFGGLVMEVLPLGVVFGLISGLTFGLSERQLSKRFSPNEGIWRSGKKGLAFGLLGGLVFGLLGALIGGLDFWLIFWLIAWLPGWLIFGRRFGLGVFVSHFVLRIFLFRQGDLPWDLITFLDEAAERLLLRKVGGSYMFVHRQLLDYFASLDEPTPRGGVE